MINVTIDNVNMVAVDIMTTITALDFKTEYLFRTCSVGTNLVTSVEFNSIHCTTMLCHIGQPRNGSVATHFILRSRIASSSVTGDYVAVLEHFGQNKEPASNNEERTRKKPSSVPKSGFNRCSFNSDM